jgi:thiamine biosynthesis lipoprotein
MGTLLRVDLWAEPDASASLFAAAWAEADRVDRLMSSWKPESEISRLAPGLCNPASPETLEVLRFSQRLCGASGGAFDVTVGPLLCLWGLYGGPARRPSDQEIDLALRRVGCSRYSIDEAQGCVRLQSGSALDLGGVAKGYALDQARAALLRLGVRRAVLDLGGQLHHIGSAHRVAVLDPTDPRQALAVFAVAEASVATSAQSERFVEIDGQRQGHILDPATGRPARGLLSVTVTHPSAMAADALSTALFVRGPALLPAVLASFPEAGVLLAADPGPARRLQPRHLTVAGRLQGNVALLQPGERSERPRGARAERSPK